VDSPRNVSSERALEGSRGRTPDAISRHPFYRLWREQVVAHGTQYDFPNTAPRDIFGCNMTPAAGAVPAPQLRA